MVYNVWLSLVGVYLIYFVGDFEFLFDRFHLIIFNILDYVLTFIWSIERPMALRIRLENLTDEINMIDDSIWFANWMKKDKNTL